MPYRRETPADVGETKDPENYPAADITHAEEKRHGSNFFYTFFT
jgi:hypothetical protein